MRQRIKRIAMTLAISGVLVGGGSAIAHAADASPSAKASSSATTSGSSNSTNATDKDRCPNE